MRIVARLIAIADTTPRRLPGDQGDVRGLDGDVRPGPDREADIGLGEGGCVVDAVADHGHRPALELELADLVGLVLREDLGEDAVDADGPADRVGGPAVVAGDHHDLEAELPEGGDGGARVGLDRIGDRDDPGDPIVEGDEDGRLAFVRETRRLVLERGGLDARRLEEDALAHEDPASAESGPDPVAGDRLEARRHERGETAPGRAVDDRRCQRVLRVAFGGGRQGEDRVDLEPGRRHDVGDGRLAERDRARLVEDDRVELLGRLERVARADQDPVGGRQARPRS